MVIGSFLSTAFAETPITVFVNDTKVSFDVEPVIENDRTLVPMRAIFEALNATVTWKSDTKTVVAEKDDVIIKITIDDCNLYKNDAVIPLDVPAKLIENRTFVPVRAISESFDASVSWDSETRQIHIKTTDKNTDGSNSAFSFSQLAPVDYANFKNDWESIFRIRFEQVDMPLAVLVDNEGFADQIRSGTLETSINPRYIWDLNMIFAATHIQDISGFTYLHDYESDDAYFDGYLDLIHDNKMESFYYFEMYHLAPDEANVYGAIFLEFYETDDPLANLCKYIAIVALPDNTIRYFTAETDWANKDNLYLCEVTTTNRYVYYPIGFDSDSFLNGVLDVLEQNTAPAKTEERNILE